MPSGHGSNYLNPLACNPRYGIFYVQNLFSEKLASLKYAGIYNKEANNMNIIEIKDHLFIKTPKGAYMVNTTELTVQPIESELYNLMAGITLLNEEIKELA